MYRYYLIVFLEGFASLAIEIICIRLFSPYFGLSAPVVGVIVSVVLVGLAIGYWLGGIASFFNPRLRLTAWATLSALAMVFINLGAGPLLVAFSDLGPVHGATLGAILLLLPPSIGFAALAPTSISLISERMRADNASGRVFALSTLGAVAGSLCASFVFLPEMGVQAGLMTCLAISVLIVVLTTPGLSVALSAAAVLLATGLLARDSAGGMTFESVYNHLEVRKSAGLHRLFVNEGSGYHSSALNPRTGLAGGYHDAAVALTLAVAPDKVLLLGSGGGTVAAQLETARIGYIGVEIDEVMTRIGREYLDLDFDKGKIEHVDARAYLRTTDERFSVIHVDLFAGNPDIPPHLASYEFFDLVVEALSPNGLVIVNFPSVIRGIPIACNYLQAALKALPSGALTEHLLLLSPSEDFAALIDPDNVPEPYWDPFVREVSISWPLQSDTTTPPFTDDWAPTYRFTTGLDAGYRAALESSLRGAPQTRCSV